MAGRRRLRLTLAELKPQESFCLEDGKFLKDELEINKTGIRFGHGGSSIEIDPAELEEQEVLGRGASSFVQRMVHKPTGKELAIKVINVFDKSKRDQLLREVRILLDSNCLSLVGFYGAYFREGTISIALEFMNRGSMEKYRGRLPERMLANATYQMLWGLGYLKHSKRVHRDIKPQNILMNSEGRVKLSDFGISRNLENSIGTCATYVGTFKYMSPERIRGHHYSYSSDIWSLGLVLVELATGEHPFAECLSPVDMVQTIVESEPPRLPGKFSDEFQEFIENCVQGNPEDRLPAEILMASPWLEMHGATSLDAAVANVKAWMDGEDAAASGGGGGESKHGGGEAKSGK
eukprot:CAMPEP_0196782142 /NCGR_PEP_ID=MMETSP1104-20130614/10795_1 /TAXON_ID=33652 /ORGANISM="Cafeteria sp., Strain Caron Lab Isolate" /LENGTH=348 /DNA_ID=CAMNT_0042152373 /DNA_START=21 /DNA_END=1067 /DNA_ORIENTATION=+